MRSVILDRQNAAARRGSLVMHGSGVAQTMFAKALAYLRAAGVRRIELIVELDNPRAIRFCQRQGFVIEGTLRRMYRRAHEDHDVDSYMALLIA